MKPNLHNETSKINTNSQINGLMRQKTNLRRYNMYFVHILNWDEILLPKIFKWAIWNCSFYWLFDVMWWKDLIWVDLPEKKTEFNFSFFSRTTNRSNENIHTLIQFHNILIPVVMWETWKLCHIIIVLPEIQSVNEPQKFIVCVYPQKFNRHMVPEKMVSLINVKIIR